MDFPDSEKDCPRLELVGSLVDSGDLQPIVDSVYSLSEVGEAFDKLSAARNKGQIVGKPVVKFVC